MEAVYDHFDRVFSRSAVAGMLMFALAGCFSSDGRAAAEEAVDTFHKRYNAKEFRQIFEATSPVFRPTAREGQFEGFLGAMRTRMGAVQASTQASSTLSMGRGRLVHLSYTTQFEHELATELFVFQIKGNVASLSDYTVRSPVPNRRVAERGFVQQ